MVVIKDAAHRSERARLNRAIKTLEGNPACVGMTTTPDDGISAPKPPEMASCIVRGGGFGLVQDAPGAKFVGTWYSAEKLVKQHVVAATDDRSETEQGKFAPRKVLLNWAVYP